MKVGQFAAQELTVAGLLTGSSILSNAILDKLDVKGGAVFGILYYLTARPISVVVALATGANGEQPLPTTLVASFAITFFASAAAAWGSTNSALDISDEKFTYGDSLALSATTLAFGSVFAAPFVYCTSLFKPEEDGYTNV